MWGFKCKFLICEVSENVKAEYKEQKKKPTMPHLCGKYIFTENKWDCK